MARLMDAEESEVAETIATFLASRGDTLACELGPITIHPIPGATVTLKALGYAAGEEYECTIQVRRVHR
jgi:hypothetical protein